MPRAQGWSEREIERRSTALARLLRRAWRVVSRAVSGSIRTHPDALVTAASLVQPTWNAQVDDEVLGYLGGVYLDAAEDVLLDLAAPADMLIGDDLVQLYLRTATNRLRGVGDHAWERVRYQLLEGQRLGESVDDIAARVAGTAGVSDARALTIARTEVHAAAESAAFEQARYVDPDALKIWLATNDSRTRPSHRAAEGQAVSMNETFVVGGSKLMFPGDPLGDPGETINCRCTLVFDLDTAPLAPEVEPEDALVAAGKKWNPTKHPRGKDGRFIKKGAVQDLLSKPKPQLLTVTEALAELDEKQWKQLTDAQKDYVTESVAKLPDGSSMKANAQKKLDKIKNTVTPTPKVSGADLVDATGKTLAPGTAAHNALTKGNYDFWDAVAALDQITWNNLTDEQRYTISVKSHDYANESDWESQEAVAKVTQLSALQKPVKPVTPTPKKVSPTPPPPVQPTSAPPTPAPTAVIPAHKGAAPGSPAKVSTALIWGKYEPGTVILEADVEQISWNGKKYEHHVAGKKVAELTKKDAYAQLKDETHWRVPGAASEPNVEDFQADVKAMWQNQWEKGLVTTQEFKAEFGELPKTESGSGTKSVPPPTTTPKTGVMGQSGMSDLKTSSPQAAASWPDQVTMSAAKTETGKVKIGYAGDALNAQLQAAAKKPVDFNPNAGVQTGKSGFYAALQSYDFNPYSNDEWHALRTYQSLVAEEWNRALRHDIPLEQTNLTAKQRKWVAQAQPKLDEMMAKSSLPASVQVWRGVKDADGSLAAKLTKGAIFEDKGYVSTSTEQSVSDKFAGPGGLLFDIEVPKGEQGLTPTRWSGRFLEEWEVVLPRGSKFEVLEAPKNVGGKRVVKVRVVTNEHDDIKTPTPVEAPTTAEVTSPPPPPPPVTPDVATPAAPTINGSSITFDEGKKYLIDKQHPAGTVVAQSAIGKERLTATGALTAGGNQMYRREVKDAAGKWMAVDSTVTGIHAIQIIRGSSTSSSSDPDWVVPKDAFSQAQSGTASSFAPPVPTEGSTTESQLIMGKLMTSGNVTAAEAVHLATSPDFTSFNWNMLNEQAKTNFVVAVDEAIDAALPQANAAFSKLNDVMYDSKKQTISSAPAPTSDAPAASITWQTGQSLNTGEAILFMKAKHTAGTVVGLSVSGNARLIASDTLPGKYELQIKASDGSWTVDKADLSHMVAVNIVIGSSITLSDEKQWLVPKDLLTAAASAPPVTTSTSTIPSAPSAPTAVPIAPPTVGQTQFIKQQFKNAKVGYWSKPEAIWEQVKAAQIAYPQFTPLQIIQALDSQLKTKEPNPYQTKLLKWLGTWKGKMVAGHSTATEFKSGTPGLAQTTGTPSAPAGPAPSLDKIDHLDSGTKSTIYADFKKLPGTFATSKPEHNYQAAQTIAAQHGLTPYQVLKVIDEVGAQKVGVTNTQIFEKKIKSWLSTSTGVAAAKTKQPAPAGAPITTSTQLSLAEQRTPTLFNNLDPNKLIPTKAESDKLTYEQIGEISAGELWSEMQAQHGAIKPGQRAGVRKYTGSQYTDMNNYLRGKSVYGISQTEINSVKATQHAMRPSTKPVLLVRGTNWVGSGTTLEQVKQMIGQTWRSDAFLSASAGNKPGYADHKTFWMYVEVPPGTPMVWADPYTQNEGELEMILAAGLHYEIISATYDSPPGYNYMTKNIVHVRVVPDPKVVKS